MGGTQAEERGMLPLPEGDRIAYARRLGKLPGIVFLPGFRSDMAGSKAVTLDAWAAETGRACLRFDYPGHGESDGRFEDGTIGAWADAARIALERLTEGPQILVGSSMGGWIMALLAKRCGPRVAGLVGVAAAPDFTERLIRPGLSDAARAALERDGRIDLPSEYADEPTPMTNLLMEEARRHMVLDAPLPFDGPVRLLHGQRDPEVPWQTSKALAQCLTGDDVVITLIKDGDHRLSRPQDLARLIATVEELCQASEASAASPSR